MDFESNRTDLILLKRYYGSKTWFKDKDALEDLTELIAKMKEIINNF